MVNDSEKYSWIGHIAVALMVLTGLYLANLYSFILFHLLVEFIGIAVSCGIFIVAWNTRRIEENPFLLFLGIAFLFVAGVNMVHTMAHEDMRIFIGYGADLPVQLWIAGRYMLALSLLIAPAMITRRFNQGLVFFIYLAVTPLILASIFYWKVFPVCVVEGSGSTPFKIASEYIISLILLGSAAFLYHKRQAFDPLVLRLLTASILITIGAELTVNFCANRSGIQIVIGHFLKILSVYLIYKAILDIGLKRPYSLMFKNLKDNEARTRLTFNAINDAVFLHPLLEDGSAPFIDVNDTACQRYGYTREEFLSLSVFDIIKKDEANARIIRDNCRKLRETGQIIFEAVHRTKSGEEFPVEVNSRIFQSGDRPVILAVMRDITERKEAEEALRESENRYRAVSELTSNYSYAYRVETDGELVLEWVTGAISRVTGFSRSELRLRGGWESLIHPDDMSIPLEQLRALLADRAKTVEYRILTKADQVRWMRDFARPYWDVGEKRVTRIEGAVQDITDYKRAEEALRRNEATLQSFIDNVPGRAFLKDGAGRYIMVNQQFLTDLGIESADRIVGSDDRELFERQTAEEFIVNDDKIRRSGKPTTFEESMEIGGRLRHYLAVKFPIGEGGEASGIIGGIAIDITERIKTEKEKEELGVQLRQAQKMEALGTLAGGIAHDFNNILAAIIGYADLALDDAERGLSNNRKIKEIIKAGERARDLVTQILTFSRKLEPELKPLDLNQVVDQTENMLARTIPRMIEIRHHLADDLWLVNADPNQLSQILMNLGANAKDSMPEGGRLIIETGNVVLDEEYADQHAEAVPGDYVLLTVSDTGHGMDRETQEKIFDPFFTNKDVGKGTGLGLATVYGIVKNHNGHIICYSEVGQGTTFRVYLPAIRSAEVDREKAAGPEMILDGDETILLVDDEEAVRDFGQQILARRGYRIITADTGEQALKIYRDRGTEIDLVVLDISMPGMGGRRCLRELFAIDPRVKVVIASGYSLNGQLKDIMASGASKFVGKPFSMTDLLKSVREILDG